MGHLQKSATLSAADLTVGMAIELTANRNGLDEWSPASRVVALHSGGALLGMVAANTGGSIVDVDYGPTDHCYTTDGTSQCGYGGRDMLVKTANGETLLPHGDSADIGTQHITNAGLVYVYDLDGTCDAAGYGHVGPLYYIGVTPAQAGKP